MKKKFFNIHNNTPKLLEYGFGSGCNTECLLEEGYEIYGIDVSKTALANTKKRIAEKKINYTKKLHLSLINENTKALNFDDNYFDYIVAMSVLSLLGSEQRIRLLLSEFKGC